MRPQNRISVFLVDDNEMFLKTEMLAFNKYFESEIKMESFVTGEDCLKKIQKNPKTAADIVILDYHLNTEFKHAMNGIEILKKIKELNPKIIVIMLSSEDKLKIANESINNGAYEFVLKSETALIRVENSLRNSVEKVLNSKIMKITLLIMDKYPELYSYIDEMPVLSPEDRDSGLMLKNLKTYYDSLYSMVKKYELEHPEINM